MNALKKWLSSPSNQTGLITLVAVVAGLISQYTSHSIDLSTLIGSLVFAVTKIIVPDNIVLQTDLKAASEDIVNQVNAKTTTSTPLVAPVTKA